jgi:glycosyltransferase involved in cell wall biosynthesis
MKILIVNVIKPQEGSRDGMTEYAYQIYERLSRKHDVDILYVTPVSKRLDKVSFVYANTLFKLKVRAAAKRDYDIIHITNQELGFAAKVLKNAGTKAKVITSIHDLMRADINSYDDPLQRFYNTLVAGSIRDCFRYSDYVISSASTVTKDAEKRFGNILKRHGTTLLGPSEEFRTTPLPKKKTKEKIVVGYVGALAPWKNPMFVAHTANLLKDIRNLHFRMYGNGPEKERILAYKDENRLDNLELLEFPPQKRFLGMYDSFNIFFYPTTEEGSSLPMLNAQSRGLPVIIYKGNKVDVEVTKYCLVAKNEADAARIIKRLISMGFDENYKRKMVNYIHGFSWDRVTNETLEIYKRVLKQK